MGIDIVLFQRLARLSSRIDPPRRSLMLGRQTLLFRGKGARFFNRALADAGLAGTTIDDLIADDGYAEKALDALGFVGIEALDNSEFEGANHIVDLNEPISDDLRGQFDFILDGGTIEHVFNVPMALSNVFEMLRPGGIFVSMNGMNGWWGHGLYQFGADLVWSFWKRAAGCEVLTCEAVPAFPKFPSVALSDPAGYKRRLRGLGSLLPTSRVYLYYEVCKPDGAELKSSVQQSDYTVKWSSGRTDTAARLGGASR